MSEIIIRFPKPLAFFLAIVGVPFFIVLTLAFTVMTFSLHTIAEQMPVWKIAAGYVLMPFMAIFSAVGTATVIRYGRETLFTTFRLSDGGVAIENSRYGMLRLAWRDIDAATYSRVMKTVVLTSHRLAKPIAIMNNAQVESDEFRTAISMVRQNLQDRFNAKWI
jgi:hypothetical protein